MPKLFQYKFNDKTYLGKTKDELFNNIIKENMFIPELNINKEELKQSVEINSTIYDTTKSQPYKAPVAMENNKVSLTQVINGAKAFLKLNSGQRVSNQEMERRAGICKYGNKGQACTRLADVSGCKSCGFGASLTSWIGKVKTFFGGDKFDIPNNLGSRYCSVCSCSLAMMIPSQTESFKIEEKDQLQRPSWCWIRKDSPNFIENP